MLTDEDIQKLTSVLATKQDVEGLREEVASLRESVQGLTNSIDSLTKAVDDLRMEYAAITQQIDRHEKWIKQIAEKTGTKLEY